MKRFFQKKVLFVSMTLLSTLLALGSFLSTYASGQEMKPVKLGITSSFSGMASVMTLKSLEASKFCVEKVYGGKILGRPIELIVRDDGLKPDKAVENFRELNLVHNVDFTLGFMSSSAACAVSPVAKKMKMPVLYWDSKSPKQVAELGSRYVFRTTADTYMDGAGAVHVISKMPWTRYVTISSDYEYGHSVVDVFKQHMSKLKPEAKVIGEFWPKLGEVDYTSYIPLIVKANPECLYVGLWGGDVMTFMRQAKPYGLFEKTAVVVLNEEGTLYSMGMEVPEGLFISCSYHFNFADATRTKASQGFLKGYTEMYGRPPINNALYGYVGTQFVLEAMKKAGTTDKEKVIDALRGMTIETPVGLMTIREYDQQADMGVYVGKTYKDPKYPKHLVMKQAGYSSGKDIMIPIEEVKKMREKVN